MKKLYIVFCLLWVIFIIVNLFVINQMREMVINSQRKPKNCLETVELYCHNLYKEDNEFGVNTKLYNECKFEKFYNDCSREDCLRYWGYNVLEPEKLTKEVALEMVEMNVVEEEIMRCFE